MRLSRQGKGTATLTEKLSIEAKRLIDSRPAWDVNISYEKSGKRESIVNLGHGLISLGMKYVI